MSAGSISVGAGDGHRFVADIFAAPVSSAIVVLLPAMGVVAGYYRPLIDNLVEAGLTVVVADPRGHGRSNVRASRRVDWGYRELVELDLAAVLDAVRQRFPDRPVYALGHSLGGQVACLHAAAHPGGLAGVALIASCSLFYRGWRFPQSLVVLAFTQFVAGLSRLLGYFPGSRIRFAGTEGRQQMLDWAANGRHGRWEIGNSSHDYEVAMRRVRIPILAMSIAGDRYCPAAAVENQLAKMLNADVTRRHWTAADLDRAGLDHFRWVRHSGPVVDLVRQWIGTTSREL